MSEGGTPKYQAGDIVRVRAWWHGREIVECCVIGVEAMHPEKPWRREHGYAVRPTSGNPHARSVKESDVEGLS